MLKNKKIYMVPVFGFLLIIGMTSILLGLPISMRNPMSYVDTIFEATSAVSATGSTTHDISQDYTLFGQVIILIAMQVGAIGFMMFFAVLYGMTKRKMRLSDAIFLENELSTNNFSIIRKRAKRIVLYTFGVEFFRCLVFGF